MIEARIQLQRQDFQLDVDLRLPERGVSALFGPSGCGKTSVLRVLAGLERAQATVRLGDTLWQDATRCVPPHQRELGYVIQEAALFPHLSVRANIAYGLKRSGAPRAGLDEAVALLGIESLMERQPAGLSGGERQRVAIARALATRPRLLLMDEPLAALDAARKAELLPYLERLSAEARMPIVYVSHALDEVARLAHTLVLMEQGRVIAAGPLHALMARLELPTARGDGAGVVHEAEIAERDAPWQLARLQLAPGFSLWARDPGQPLGHRARVRVLARDVSLSRTPHADSSIGNQLQGVVEALAQDEHPSLQLVRVQVAGLPVLARLSKRSAHALALAPGLPVWVHVKTVALMA